MLKWPFLAWLFCAAAPIAACSVDRAVVGAAVDQRVPDQALPDAVTPDLAVPDGALPDGAPPDVMVPDRPRPDRVPPPDSVSTIPGTWVTIPAGTFQMGSPSSEKCRDTDETLHKVVLTRSFMIMTTEVTQAQFSSVRGYNPSYPTSCGGTCPVDRVSWYEAAVYANVLSARAGKAACYVCSWIGKSVTCSEAAAYSGKKIYSCPGYRLPTEAEWEYAYRAGTKTAFHNGGITSCSKDATLDKIAWYHFNAGLKAHPVGQKAANAWGLYDMAGNVGELCEDWYSAYPTASVTDPVGSPPVSPPGLGRVERASGWGYYAYVARAASRCSLGPGESSRHVGFRLVRTVK